MKALIPYDAFKTPLGAGWLGGGLAVMALTLFLLVDTVTSYLGQVEQQATVLAFAQGESGEVRARIERLRQANGDDPRWAQLLGCYTLDRAELAESASERASAYARAAEAFERAIALDARDSAYLGLAAARLGQAVSDAENRRGRVDAAGQALEYLGPSDPDRLTLEALVALLRNDAAGARARLETKAERFPGRDGCAARQFNLAAVRALGSSPEALEPALAAFLMRRWPLGKRRNDPARLLVLAYRLALADPAAGPETLRQRLELGERALTVRYLAPQLTGGPFLPPRELLAPVLNAKGLALVRVGRPAEALEAFDEARQLAPANDAYDANRVAALIEAARRDPGRWGASASDACFRRAETLAKASLEAMNPQAQAAHAARIRSLADNGAVLALGLQKAGAALPRWRQLVEALPIEDEASHFRDLGAVLDHAGDAGCVAAYQKAIRAGFPDDVALEQRIRVYRSRGRR